MCLYLWHSFVKSRFFSKLQWDPKQGSFMKYLVGAEVFSDRHVPGGLPQLTIPSTVPKGLVQRRQAISNCRIELLWDHKCSRRYPLQSLVANSFRNWKLGVSWESMRLWRCFLSGLIASTCWVFWGGFFWHWTFKMSVLWTLNQCPSLFLFYPANSVFSYFHCEIIQVKKQKICQIY